MANYWAIAIGINQYQFFQPLGCAQADAEKLNATLVAQAGFKSEKCLLMTDSSPVFGDRSTYPTKENILLLLEDLAATRWEPQDQVWFFFSGYGVNHDGRDYLMPQSAHPDLVAETGIDIRGLLQSLQVAPINALVLLDMNRAFGTQANALVGQETIELAKELKIPTIVSCQPEQFSYESGEINHGFFAAALIEAIRSGNANTTGRLANYLSTRIPELCQHHWRPTQNPVTVIPNNELVILPETLGDIQEKQPIASKNAPANSEAQEEVVYFDSSRAAPSLAPSLENSEMARETTKEPINSEILEKTNENQNSPPLEFTEIKPVDNNEDKKPNVTQLGKNLLVLAGGGMVLLTLVMAFFFRNFAAPGSDEPYKRDNTANNQSGKANNTTSPNPQEKEQSQSSQEKQALAQLRRNSKNPNQLKDLSEAIAAARKITPGDPRYDQTQENIQIWSQRIFDIAEERVREGEYAGAITALGSITKDDPQYQKAQENINQWQNEAKQFMSSKTLIEAAGALIRPGQASTYNKAIEVAKRVNPGEAGFELAQQSINQWSQEIFKIASSRAARRDFKSAISTAQLVPEGTTAYTEAQQAIQKWQSRVRN